MRHAVLFLALSLSAAGSSPAAMAQSGAPPEVELKLFEKSEVDLSKGCSVALWQADRDPDKDKFAYVFTEALSGKNHTRQPAKMKIGGQVVPLQRVATGGRTTGYSLFEYQLYKLPGENNFAIFDLKLADEMGEAVDVESGRITLALAGKALFRIAVKGGAGCNTPPAAEAPAQKPAAPAAAPAGPSLFQRYTPRAQQVPKAVLQAAQKQFGCRPEIMATGITGFQMSEESAIWDIPCDVYAYQGSSVFALVYLPDPAQNLSFLAIPGPKGKQRPAEPGMLMSPQWDVKTRMVSSFAKGRGQGDCGVLERYRVTAEGQFALVDYREKPSCDGKMVKPEQYPLVYPAR